jgi:hypothetical protein
MNGEGVRWPWLPNMDYRYGFPLSAYALAELAGVSVAVRDEMLSHLEAAAFEALVRCDLAELLVAEET